MKLSILWLSLLVFFANPAPAQEQREKLDASERNYEFFPHSGAFLPYGIYGVRDQYPYFGFKIGHPFRIWRLEWEANFVNAKAVSYYNGALSLLLRTKLDFITMNFTFGPDVHYYKGIVIGADVDQPFRLAAGWHFGFGPELEISPTLKLRGDFKYSYSPGNTLFAGIGLVFAAEPSSDKDEKAQ